MLIDETYFTGRLKISNIEEPSPNNVVQENISTLIRRGQEELLTAFFGVKMYLDLIEKYQRDKDNLPQNYKDLLRGKDYTREGKTYYWKGLINDENKTSLLADYIYIVYQLENVYQTTAFGQTRIEGKIGEIVSVVPKITKIYNEFIQQVQGGKGAFSHGLTHEGNLYKMLKRGIDYTRGRNGNAYVSLYQFLEDNEADFPLLELDKWIIWEPQNEFGI